MQDSANQTPDELNWADYCDALRSEHWRRLLDAARGARRTGTSFEAGRGPSTPVSRVASTDSGVEAGSK